MRMVKPKVKVIRFSGDDVIATSGGYPIVPQFLTLSNFSDEDPTNNTLSYVYSSTGDSSSFTPSDGGKDKLVAYLQEFVNKSKKDDPGTVSESTMFNIKDGFFTWSYSTGELLNLSMEPKLDGNYTWQRNAFRKQTN